MAAPGAADTARLLKRLRAEYENLELNQDCFGPLFTLLNILSPLVFYIVNNQPEQSPRNLRESVNSRLSSFFLACLTWFIFTYLRFADWYAKPTIETSLSDRQIEVHQDRINLLMRMVQYIGAKWFYQTAKGKKAIATYLKSEEGTDWSDDFEHYGSSGENSRAMASNRMLSDFERAYEIWDQSYTLGETMGMENWPYHLFQWDKTVDVRKLWECLFRKLSIKIPDDQIRDTPNYQHLQKFANVAGFRNELDAKFDDLMHYRSEARANSSNDSEIRAEDQEYQSVAIRQMEKNRLVIGIIYLWILSEGTVSTAVQIQDLVSTFTEMTKRRNFIAAFDRFYKKTTGAFKEALKKIILPTATIHTPPIFATKQNYIYYLATILGGDTFASLVPGGVQALTVCIDIAEVDEANGFEFTSDSAMKDVIAGRYAKYEAYFQRAMSGCSATTSLCTSGGQFYEALYGNSEVANMKIPLYYHILRPGIKLFQQAGILIACATASNQCSSISPIILAHLIEVIGTGEVCESDNLREVTGYENFKDCGPIYLEYPDENQGDQQSKEVYMPDWNQTIDAPWKMESLEVRVRGYQSGINSAIVRPRIVHVSRSLDDESMFQNLDSDRMVAALSENAILKGLLAKTKEGIVDIKERQAEARERRQRAQESQAHLEEQALVHQQNLELQMGEMNNLPAAGSVDTPLIGGVNPDSMIHTLSPSPVSAQVGQYPAPVAHVGPVPLHSFGSTEVSGFEIHAPPTQSPQPLAPQLLAPQLLAPSFSAPVALPSAGASASSTASLFPDDSAVSAKKKGLLGRFGFS